MFAAGVSIQLAVALSGRGSDTKTVASSSSKTTTSKTMAKAIVEQTKPNVGPRDEDAAG